MFRLWTAALALALTVALLAPGGVALAADPPQGGAVEGTVTNGTDQGKSTAGLAVTLSVFQNGAEKETRQAKADSQGRYRFDGLTRDPALSYQTRVDFDGITYRSDPETFSPDSATLPLNLTLYETTDSPSAIQVSRLGVVVTVTDGLLTLIEHYDIVNSGNRTYIGSESSQLRERTTLSFVLPNNSGAPDLMQGFDENKAFITRNAIFDSQPMLPGTKEFMFAYHVGYTNATYTVRRPLLYPVKRVDVLLRSEDLGLASRRLSKEPPTTINGQRFQHLLGYDFVRGEAIDITLSGLWVPREQEYLRIGGIGLAALGLGFALIYGLRRRSPSPPEERERRLREIAALDDEHAEGRLSNEEHQARRAACKARLLDTTGSAAPASTEAPGGR